MKEYFSHDYGARHDRKIVALVNKYKSAGYGIFWTTNEMMHEEGGMLELDELTFGAISKHLNEDVDLIREVINDCIYIFKLYILSGEKLTSNRVINNLADREEKKIGKIEAGRLGGIKSGESRRTKQNEALLEADEALLEATNQRKGKEIKERKGEEIKEKEIIERKMPENFVLHNIYSKNYSELNGAFKDLTEKGFLLWKKFVDFILKKNYSEIFSCKFITPQDFEKIDFPESTWDDTIKSLLSTGIKPEHNLYFRIPKFIKYGLNSTKGSTQSSGSGISGTSVIPSDKQYKRG